MQAAHNAAFANMGQVCNAGSRTYVHEDIYDQFVQKSVELAKKRVIGDPFDKSTQAGPQVLRVQEMQLTRLAYKCVYFAHACTGAQRST